MLAGVLLALPSVVVAGLAKTFVNKYLIGGSTQWFDAVLIAFVLAAVLQVGLSALQQAAMTRCSRKMSITMSADYLWHLLRLPIPHFVARPPGDLGFLMSLNDKSATALGRRLATTFMSVVIALITGVFLARFSGWLMLIVLGLTALSVLAVQLVSKRLAPIARELTTAQAEMFGTATGGISSIESLKANGAEESLFGRWASSYSRTLVLDQRMGVVNATVNAIPNLSVLLMTTAVIGVGGAQVIAGSITLGDLVGFQSLLMPFLAANSAVLNSSALLRRVISESRTARRDRPAAHRLGHRRIRDHAARGWRGEARRRAGGPGSDLRLPAGGTAAHRGPGSPPRTRHPGRPRRWQRQREVDRRAAGDRAARAVGRPDPLRRPAPARAPAGGPGALRRASSSRRSTCSTARWRRTSPSGTRPSPSPT